MIHLTALNSILFPIFFGFGLAPFKQTQFGYIPLADDSILTSDKKEEKEAERSI